jgi:hypothetical protein
MKDNNEAETVAFVVANESDPLSQRDCGAAATRSLPKSRWCLPLSYVSVALPW